jgi:hypothetical protein
MKLISTVSSDHDDTSGCDYALIDLGADLARLALKRVGTLKAEKQRDPDLDEMYFWDYHVEYFSPWNAEEGENADSLRATLDNLPAVGDGLMRAPDDFLLPEEPLARIECGQMIVRDSGIAFIAIPKHASYYIRTAEIPIQMIEAAAAA